MKTILVAALAASMLVVPAMPASAKTMTTAEKDCLIFPMLKKQCWDMAAEKTSDSMSSMHVKLPVYWWQCKPAPKGSGHLLDC